MKSSNFFPFIFHPIPNYHYPPSPAHSNCSLLWIIHAIILNFHSFIRNFCTVKKYQQHYNRNHYHLKKITAVEVLIIKRIWRSIWHFFPLFEPPLNWIKIQGTKVISFFQCLFMNVLRLPTFIFIDWWETIFFGIEGYRF